MTDIGKLLMLHVDDKISIDTLLTITKPMKTLNETQREEMAQKILTMCSKGGNRAGANKCFHRLSLAVDFK